jgi:hypothetical protein
MKAASLLYAKSVVAVISCFGGERFTFLRHFCPSSQEGNAGQPKLMHFSSGFCIQIYIISRIPTAKAWLYDAMNVAIREFESRTPAVHKAT